MNQNQVAITVTKKEGGKVNQSIAQIKETIKLYNRLVLLKTGIDLPAVLRKVKD